MAAGGLAGGSSSTEASIPAGPPRFTKGIDERMSPKIRLRNPDEREHTHDVPSPSSAISPVVSCPNSAEVDPEPVEPMVEGSAGALLDEGVPPGGVTFLRLTNRDPSRGLHARNHDAPTFAVNPLSVIVADSWYSS
jgi:hypothetical protein